MELPPRPSTSDPLDDTASISSHDRILQAARTLFALQGYENTTTSMIARKAGTSESQLIKHFGSKEGLLEAIFDRSWGLMEPVARQILERDGTPLDKLRAVTEMMMVGLERDNDLRSLMLLEGRRIRRHGNLVVLTRGYTLVVGVIDRLLGEMREAGMLREGLHLEAVRSALIGGFEGLLRDQLLAERVGYPARYTSQELRGAFSALLDGFLRPGARSDDR